MRASQPRLLAPLSSSEPGWAQDGTGEDEASNSNSLPHKGVIKVTIQYRMGVFGHFCHPEMGAVNVGTLDQIAALEWIQENIVSPSRNHSLAAPRSPVTTTATATSSRAWTKKRFSSGRRRSEAIRRM